MIDIEEYMKLPLEERRSHLNLEEPCVERGGISSYCKGLLAEKFDTTIPSGMKIHVCHACHNAKCSNPNHLYWGSAKENWHDSKQNGKSYTAYENTVRKYGEEKALEMAKERGKLHQKYVKKYHFKSTSL